MIDRRGFCRQSLGLSLGLGGGVAWSGGPSRGDAIAGGDHRLQPALSDFERIMAATTHMEKLGLPRSWWVVREVFHPVAPERVVIVTRKVDLTDEYIIGRMRDPLLAETLNWRRRWNESAQLGYSLDKLDMIPRVILPLTRYYRIPECLNSWARRMAVREDLGSTGVSRHMALFHQFQHPPGPAPTTNGGVDWWLFLFPEGMDWDGWDDQPVHMGLCPIFTDYAPGLALRVYEVISRLMRAIATDETVNLSRMDRVCAARFVNLRVAQFLADWKD